VSLSLLLVARDAAASNILRRASGAGTRGVSEPSDAASQAAAAAQAAAQAQSAQPPLKRALDAIRAFQAAQDAARAAAAAEASSVPNGLGPGGLDPLQPLNGGTWLNVQLPGADSVKTTQDGRKEVDIVQTGSRAILTWKTFNVGRETDLVFDQSAGGSDANSWAALNRVLDPNGKPSSILGSIKAPGQVYILNRNGVVFGGTSQVNVGSLLVSGLEIGTPAPIGANPIATATEADSNAHFLNDPLAGLAFERPIWGQPGQGDLATKVVVEPGARIAAASGGRVVLLGGTVRNGGTIESPDGQIFLAAGARIQLAPATDLSATRGLRPPDDSVSQDSAGLPCFAYSPLAELDGPVVNTGILSARRGNVTMVGNETVQAGLVNVTTGAQAVGSIYIGQVGLRTTIGEGSVTQVLPDLDEKDTILGSGESFKASANSVTSINVVGNRIDVLDGATLYAPSGKISLNAYMTADKPADPNATPLDLDTTRIYVASGARIDVSGLRDVEVAMEQNTIRAELHADELRDNPLLRDGPLRGQTVYFDARLGGKLKDGSGVADLSGYYAVTEHKVSEFMTAGGSITMNANWLVTREGSVLDVSGGSLKYADGYVRRTVLVTETGARVPIEFASKGVKYVGVDGEFVASHARWGVPETFASALGRSRPRFEKGYVQGSSAGTIYIGVNQPVWSAREQQPGKTGNIDFPASPSSAAAVRILDGSIVASTVTGPLQREVGSAPAGGTLVIRGAADVSIGNFGPLLPASFGPDSQIDPSWYGAHPLSASWFGTSGLSKVSIECGYDDSPAPANRAPGGNLTVAGGVVVDLGDSGSFSFTGKSACIDGVILAPGGVVKLTALDKVQAAKDPSSGQYVPVGDVALANTLTLGANAIIDVAGRVTNDVLDGPGLPLRPLNGGSVSLSASTITLKAGSKIDVSGGARLGASGTKLKGGDAGSISLDVSGYPKPTGIGVGQVPATPPDGSLVLLGTLEGHALGKGGTLTISTGKEISIGEDSPKPDSLALDAGFLTRGGFATYSLVGNRGVTVVGVLTPTVDSFDVPDPSQLRSGTRLADVAGVKRVLDPAGYGAPMSINLSTGSTTYSETKPEVKLTETVAIRMAPRSTVTLQSSDLLQIDGRIESKGGTVNLFDGGQNGDRGIVLGDSAQILVPGYQQSAKVGGAVVHSVVQGGTLTIGDVGGAQAKNVHINTGAVINASGAAGRVDLPVVNGSPGQAARFQAVSVQGNAGSISISAAQGLVAGDLRLAPGDTKGESTVGTGLGGSLTLVTKQQVVVSNDPSASAEAAGVLRLRAPTVNASSADDVTIQVGTLSDGVNGQKAIQFEGPGLVELTSGRSLVLAAPILGTVAASAPDNVTLRSSYVALIGGFTTSQPAVQTVNPDAHTQLDVKADVIDVARTVVLGPVGQGTLGIGGFTGATFDAKSDIRLSDHDPAGRDAGFSQNTFSGLLSPGGLELRAGQVYVVSRGRDPTKAITLERSDSDPGFLVQSASHITIEPPQGDGSVSPSSSPLSFGERLTLRAPTIDQGGVLRAPAGQIRLEGDTVTLLPGSVTSVSLVGADGKGQAVPFGPVGTDGVFYGYAQPGQSPTLSVRLQGANVDVRSGATVDVSGGGDLLGSTFVSGNGGSSDVLGYVKDSKGNLLGSPSLGNNLSAPFAVLPSLGTAPLPISPIDSLRDPRLRVGDQVWLQGVPGLAPGYYTLLPARYALLPGGLLVQPLGGSLATAPQSFTRADGATVAAGYRAVNGERRDAGWGSFAVMGQDVFGKYAQLEVPSFNAFAERNASDAGVAVRTLADGGVATFAATSQLSLAGTGRFGAGPGGSSGSLEVTSSRIAVASAAAAGNYAGYVVIDPEAIERFGAQSVLIGGTRSQSLDPAQPGAVLNTAATDVVVDTAGQTWSASEILLAASNQVTVASGSTIRAEGSAAGDTRTLRLSGNGVLLRVSAGDRVGIVRTNGSAGGLSVGDATLSASGSIALEAGGTVALSAGVALATPKLDLASTQVHLGAAPQGAAGTVLGRDLIERLAASSDLLIRGHEQIVFHGDLALGSRAGATLPSLTLDAPLVQGDPGAPGTVRITAGQLELRNSGGVAASTAGTGVLELDVDQLTLGPGNVVVAGFGQVAGRAGTILAQGSGGLSLAGTLGTADRPFATGAIGVASSGVSYDLSSAGAIFLGSDSAVNAGAGTTLGGRLTLSGSSISLDTKVMLPAGTFEAVARDGSLALEAHASVDVSGQAVDMVDVVRFAPGGTIRLSAARDLSLSAGAVLDVSGSSRGGDAGNVELTAGGLASVEADLRGRAEKDQRGAAFALDAGSVPDFGALSRAVEQGGFTESRSYRVRDPGQDLVLAQGANNRISAHDVTLRSDAGRVSVSEAVGLAGDRSHAAGGRIELAGGTGVEVTTSATLDARAAAADADGFVPASGRVLVATTGGSALVSGRIDVSGGRDGGGSIVVRAPRTVNGVAVTALDGDFVGATEKVVQGLDVIETNAVDAAWLAARQGEAQSWLAAARKRFPQGINGFELAPAIVAKSQGSLSLAGKLSLSSSDGTAPGGPGYLGFVAAGEIDVGAVVSDGFGATASDAFASTDPQARLLSGKSFGLGFETDGSIVFRRGAMVRTGTGDIAIHAGRDVTLEDPVLGTPAAVIYTAGEKTGRTAGFTDPSVPATAYFPTHGGSIDISAGGDVVAPLASQTTSAWLFRYGDTAWNGTFASSTVRQQTSWSVVYKNFQQGVAALGGGDVRVQADGNVVRLQVAVPTTGQLTTPVGQTPAPGDLVVRGGGDMVVSAGRDLLGGLYVLGEGHGDLRAGGSIAPDPAQTASIRSSWGVQNSRIGNQRAVGLLVGLADATVRVNAGSSAVIEGVFDPMREGQIGENQSNGKLIGSVGSAFVGYQDRSALAVTAVGGAVTYNSNPWAAVDLSQSANTPTSFQVAQTGSLGLNAQFGEASPTLKLASLSSDATVATVSVLPELKLGPAAPGTLEILAKENVVLRLDITQVGRDLLPVRDWRAAFSTTVTAADGSTVANLGQVSSPVSGGPLHQTDLEPNRIYAVDGSVCAQDSTGTCLRQPPPLIDGTLIKLTSPKALHVVAGKDLLAGDYDVQGNGENDLSLFSAGRDVYQPVLELYGQGTAVVEAGRDVVLGEGQVKIGTLVAPPLSGGAFISNGNLQGNQPIPGLPRDKGVDLYVLAGMSKDRVNEEAFTAAYLDPSNAAQRAVRDYFPELRAYMARLEPVSRALSEADLVAAFRALPEPQRRTFLVGVLMTELRETGIDYNDAQSPRYRSYDRGFKAISTLFPVNPATVPEGAGGNVLLHGKRVETNAEAGITILAPYGRVEVGTDAMQARVDYGRGGVVTRRGGDIRIMADQDISLFTSRVFTLQGGDITMWTSDGSITAGTGSKTSVFQKPLSYTMTDDGVILVNTFGIQTGAGIGVLDALGDASERKRSRLDLIAPRGEVNAGDAGIRVVGDLNIAAQVVVGIENIQVSGASQGVPKVEAPNIGALTTAASVSQAAAKEGVGPQAAPRNAAADLPSIITVELVGYETTEPASDGAQERKKKQ
jgi:filamentous hemagglutinin family protein